MCPGGKTRNNCATESSLGSLRQIDACSLTGYTYLMRFRNIVHKGIKRLYMEDKAKGLPPDTVDKLRKMLAFLQDMENADELHPISLWKAHQMKGDRKGTWSLHVTRNWRLTFLIDTEEHEIYDLDFEDYH